MPNKRCCSSFQDKSGGCTLHSKITMVVQLKKEYKKLDRSPTFYSWVYLNAKENNFIIQGMLSRIERLYKNQYNVIQFFEKGIDQPIHEHKP